jgi:hypothetical protein
MQLATYKSRTCYLLSSGYIINQITLKLLSDVGLWEQYMRQQIFCWNFSLKILFVYFFYK